MIDDVKKRSPASPAQQLLMMQIISDSMFALHKTALRDTTSGMSDSWKVREAAIANDDIILYTRFNAHSTVWSDLV
jgi:hypothetical protein